MATQYVDIHPHIISTDLDRYPPNPLFGKQSDWSKERPVALENLLAEMDEAGIEKAAIVQSSTCYGYDNSYVCDACAQHPGRLTAVGSVDLMADDAREKIEGWAKRGLEGLRLFTGGSTKAFDTSSLDHPDSFPAWELAAEMGLSVCIQTGPVGLTQVAGLAKRFPKAKIILDHLSRPVIDDGAPYVKAVSLWALAPFENIYFKVTPRTTDLVQTGNADPESFFNMMLDRFGAHRMAWGSNYPASEGRLTDNLEVSKRMLAYLPAEVQHQIFASTAMALYPSLKDAE